MINKLTITDVSKAKLFTIETNASFAFRPIEISNDILSVVNAFDLNNPVLAEKLIKPSPTSTLYRLKLEDGSILILRKCLLSKLSLLSAQCELSSLLSDLVFIQPLRLQRNNFVLQLGKSAWIAYPYIQGKIYTGENCNIDSLLNSVLDFEESLSNASKKLSNIHKTNLPTQTHRTSDWGAFYAELLGNTTVILKSLDIHLSELSMVLIKKNKQTIMELIGSSTRLIKKGKPTLIHNDLNHANIIIKDNTPIFLDLEDIVFEIPEISITHSLFKLLRHRILQKHTSIINTEKKILEFLPKLAINGYTIQNKEALFLYGVARIFSDIHTIFMNVIEDKDYRLVYDLEKKIHNLFELSLMVWPSNGFKT